MLFFSLRRNFKIEFQKNRTNCSLNKKLLCQTTKYNFKPKNKPTEKL